MHLMLGPVFGMTGAMVFRDGRALRMWLPTKKTFSSPKYKTHALWFSGRGVWLELDGLRSSNIQEVILPDPRNEELLASLDASFSDMNLDSVTAIKNGTKNAQSLGIKVYRTGMTDGRAWP